MKQIQRLYANSDRKYFEVFKFKTQKTFSSMFTYLNCAYCVTISTWTLGLSSSSSRRTSSQALHPANIQNLRSAGFAHFVIEGHQLKIRIPQYKYNQIEPPMPPCVESHLLRDSSKPVVINLLLLGPIS